MIKVENGVESAKIVTNVQTFRDCGLLQNALRERFGEHLRSINKIAPGFPVAEHFGSNGHTAADALVRGIKLCERNRQRKRQEMRLICRLGTCQPRGLNADFQLI